MLAVLPVHAPADGRQADARKPDGLTDPGVALVVTDPPYFGQIDYSDLSDYFYLWLRRALRMSTLTCSRRWRRPKSEELVANPAVTPVQ